MYLAFARGDLEAENMRILAKIPILLLAMAASYDSVIAGTVYAIDAGTQTIVRFDSTTGEVLGSIPTPSIASGGPDGLSASGTSLFFVNAIGSNVIHQVDASTGANVDAFPAPLMAGGTDGLAYMDGFLYTLDGAADTIFKVDVATQQVVSSCHTGMYAVGALAGENGRLFAVLGLMRIAELNPDTCALIGGPFGVPGGDFVLGLAFDGTELFAATFMSPAIYVMNPDTGAILRAFHPGFAASGLAASGETAGSTPVSVVVDFMPNNCGNPLNVRANPVVAAVVVGTDDLDVGSIDVSSVRLEGVAPIRSVYRDRATPGRCRSDVNDGKLDLVLVFSASELVSAMLSQAVPLTDGQTTTVHLHGLMHDGTAFEGEDRVTLRNNPLGNGPAGSALRNRTAH
jgi:hypothetical protein